MGRSLALMRRTRRRTRTKAPGLAATSFLSSNPMLKAWGHPSADRVQGRFGTLPEQITALQALPAAAVGVCL